MPYKDPQTQFIAGCILSAFAGVGGFLAYALRAVQSGEPFSWARGAIEFASSAFVGAIAFMLCYALNIDEWWIGPICGTFGWMGAKVSMLAIRAKVENLLGVDVPDDEEVKQDDPDN